MLQGRRAASADLGAWRRTDAVFWAYDGWVYITWVAGEVKDPRRKLHWPWYSGACCGVIYLAMKHDYVYALPLARWPNMTRIAHAAAAALFSPEAAIWLSAMIAISCFSAAAGRWHSVWLARLSRDGAGRRFLQSAWLCIHPQVASARLSLIGQGIWAAVPDHERTLTTSFTPT